MRKLVLVALLIAAGCKDVDETAQRVNLPIDKIPANVLKTAQAKFPDVKFDMAWKLNSGTIEVRGKNKIGKVHEVEMSAAGDIVETN
jgi:hypothetical protein